jgi:aminomethyltransferase
MPLRTPLYDRHLALGARCIEFGGWEMPVQYAGITAEHLAVRAGAGLFDISHMGELMVGGAHARQFLNRILTNDIEKLAVGQAQYTLMCREDGGVVDDLYVYHVASEAFLLIVNATRIEADEHWLEFMLSKLDNRWAVKIENQSDDTGALALQGSATPLIIDELFDRHGLIGVKQPSDLKKNQIDAFRFGGGEVFVARTGYTGEDGFELVAPNELLGPLWDRLLELGAPHGIQPAGLGARDTLRLEMGYPLYGHELSEEISPIEAGLKYFVKLDKGEFTGRDALARQAEEPPVRKAVAFQMTGKSPPPREGYDIFVDEDNLIHDEVWSWGSEGLQHQEDDPHIGQVTSGTQSPCLKRGIGLALVNANYTEPGKTIHIKIRDKTFPAAICKKPFYKKP